MAQFGDRYECESPRAGELQEAFEQACRRAGILYRMEDIINSYQARYEKRQLTLFE